MSLTPWGTPAPDETLPGAPAVAPAPGPGLRDILAEEEEPSSFESFFRFIGRPGFMVRTLLSGDLVGFGKNLAQFGQELANPLGIFNHSLTPSAMLGFSPDLTTAEDRPEFSDLAHRWGMVSDRTQLGAGEKFLLDFAGGFVTDPLSLVGGGEAKVGTTGAKLAGLGRTAARQELVGALRRGAEGTGKNLFEQFMGHVGTGLERVRNTGNAPGFEALSNIQSLDELHALTKTLPGEGVGLTSTIAAKIARDVEGRAAETTFFNTLRQATEEGVNLRRGTQGRIPTAPVEEGFGKFMSGHPEAALPEVENLLAGAQKSAVLAGPSGLMDDLTPTLTALGERGHDANSALATGNLKALDLNLGQKLKVLFRPQNETSVGKAVATINDAAKIMEEAAVGPAMGPQRFGARSFTRMRDGLRDLGFSDEWINPLLERQFPGIAKPLTGSLDDYVRLGHDMPLSVANEGVEALIQAGMAPGGGLTFNPLWSDAIGKAAERNLGWTYRNGYNFIPWGDVAQATGPGMLRSIALRMGLEGPTLLDETVKNSFTTLQRKILDRFRFGYAEGVNAKAATAMEEFARASDQEWRGGSLATVRRGVENMGDEALAKTPAFQHLTDETFKAEDTYHAAITAWGADGEGAKHLEGIVAKLGAALPRSVEGNASAVKTVGEDLVKLVRSLEPEIKDAPWNAPLKKDTLRDLVSRGAASGVRTVQKAGEEAAVLLAKWEKADAPLARAEHAAKLGFRVLDQAHAEASMLSNAMGPQVAALRTGMKAMAAVTEERKHVHVALRALRRLADATPPGQAVAQEIKDTARTLLLKQQELGASSQGIRTELRNIARANGDQQGRWVSMLDQADRMIRRADMDMKASGRVWNKLTDQVNVAFNKRNGELGSAVHASARSLLAGNLTQQIIDNVVAKVGELHRPAIEKTVNYGQEEMRKIANFMKFHAKNTEDLMRGSPSARPAWEHLDAANPFYIPHQARPELVEAMTNPRISESAKNVLLTEFDKARKMPTAKAFLEHMAEVADSLGLEAMADEQLVQRDYRGLVLQRGLAFEKTKALQKLYQGAIKIAGKEGGAWKTYQTYLDGVLQPVGPRKNTFLKFFSGGKFDIPLGTKREFKPTMEWLNKSMDAHPDMNPFAKLVRKEGSNYMRIAWPGLNAFYKPFLTSIPTNVRFRFRNLLAGPLQASFHPEIRFSGIEPIYKALRHDGLVRWGISHFDKPAAGEFSAGWSKGHKLGDSAALASMTPEQRVSWATSTLTRAFTAPSAAERMAARGAMGNLRDMVGPYSWPEAMDIVDGVLARKQIVQTDLKEGVANLSDLMAHINKPTHNDPNVMGKIVRGLRKFVDFGMSISEEHESQMRILAALNLMKAGKSPVEVVSQVSRLMVDYSLQSEVEQTMRSVVPFARYMIGATGWVKDMVSNPSGAGKGLIGHAASIPGLGMAQRSLQGGGEGPAVLPRSAKETLALPLPWKDLEGNREFLVSLGFPQEVAINMLSLVGGRREALMHTVAGGMHPVLKAPAEFLSNRNFFFGSEWGEYRKSPFLLEPFAKDVPAPDGTTRKEVPGALNELINASPVSGVESTINRLADSRRGIAGRLINAMTGFNVQSVDEESELQKRIAEYLKDKVRSGQVGELQVFFQRLKPEDVPDEVKKVLSALEESRAAKRRANKKPKEAAK